MKKYIENLTMKNLFPYKFLYMLPLLFLFPAHLHAQEFLLAGKSHIRSVLSTATESGFKISFSENIIAIDTLREPRDTSLCLSAYLEGKEKIDLFYYFKSMYGGCDSIVIRYYCSECITGHIIDFLMNKKRGWVETDSNIYLSSKPVEKYVTREQGYPERTRKITGVPQMVISGKRGEEVCTTVIFSIRYLDENTWKKLVKK